MVSEQSRRRPFASYALPLFAACPLLLLLFSRATAQKIGFDRTPGQVEVGTCEGLKKYAELGIDVSIVVTENLLCPQGISISPGADVSIGSAFGDSYLIAIAEDFLAPKTSSASLFVNPRGSYLSLYELTIVNEAGLSGSPGQVRAVWNEGTLDVDGCIFNGLNFAALQDGGAIYSTAEPGNAGGAFVSARNSTFVGNVAANYGGAIASWGQGEIELRNCSFVGNEAVGAGDFRRAGSGGAVYASPGVFVTVHNSSFEGCLGRYGGAALFACGADISESTFNGNEATGLFGAVVNGDLSGEERVEATATLGGGGGGGGGGGNFTCPPLSVSGTLFDKNAATTGYGGAIASVDSSLTVYNSSLLDSLGGGIYFGTSNAGDARDRLELELIQFNSNDGSLSSPNFVGAALLVERTGSPASNTTGPIEDVPPSGSSSSSVAAVQSVGAAAGGGLSFVGAATEMYCFQNSPYDCEMYFGDGGDGDVGEVLVQLTGTIRCNACRGTSFTGIGSAVGAPIPSPVNAVDDDDGLSQMGQERAQGGTPSPTAVGTPPGARGGVGSEQEPKLLGATGGMRWVVVGLIVGIGGALLVCMCLLTVCRIRDKRERGRRGGDLRRPSALLGLGGGGGDGEGREGRPGSAAMVGPRSASSIADDDRQERGFGSGGISTGGGSPARDFLSVNLPKSSVVANVEVEQPQTGPGSGTRRRPSRRAAATATAADPSFRETIDSAVAVVDELTPHASELKARELARQRSIELKAAEWASPPLVSAWGDDFPVGGTGHVALSRRSTPSKKGFTALEDEQEKLEVEEARRRGRSSRSRERRAAAAAGGARLAVSADAADRAASRVTTVRGSIHGERRGRSRTSRRAPSSTAYDDVDSNTAATVGRGSSSSAERENFPSAAWNESAGGGGGGGGGGKRQRRVKPPGGGSTAVDGTSWRGRSSDRALVRAVKTPAGGARLSSISAAASPPLHAVRSTSTRAPQSSSSAAAAAAAAEAAAKLEGASGEGGFSQWEPDSTTMVSSEDNPVYGHRSLEVTGAGGGSSRSRSGGPFRSSGRVGSSDERREPKNGAGDGGWAAELY